MFEVFTRPFKIAKELNFLAAAVRARQLFAGNLPRSYLQSVALNKLGAMIYIADRNGPDNREKEIVISLIAELFEVLLYLVDSEKKISIAGGVSGAPCHIACECLDSPEMAISHLNAYCELNGLELTECVKEYLGASHE